VTNRLDVLPTTNHEWGFWGTIRQHVEPAEAWDLAMHAIANTTGSPDAAVRDFLDSRFGRQFADDVENSLSRGLALHESILAAVTQWERWKITRETMRAMGIPCGLPYLSGFVAHFEVMADTVD
jgi:hypothetical protein